LLKQLIQDVSRRKLRKARQGFVSVNVDTMFDPDSRSGATGVVIQDDKGNFLAACNNNIDLALDLATLKPWLSVMVYI
jgi:hypothetical protein